GWLGASPPIPSRWLRPVLDADIENKETVFFFLKKIWKQKHAHEWAYKITKLLIEEDNSWELTASWTDKRVTKLLAHGGTTSTRVPPEHKIILDKHAKFHKPDTPLLLATIHGSTEIVREILLRYPQAVEHVDEDGHNILHLAILYRRHKVIDVVEDMEYPLERLRGRVDKSYNTLLHMVGQKVDELREDVKHPAEELKIDQRLYKSNSKTSSAKTQKPTNSSSSPSTTSSSGTTTLPKPPIASHEVSREGRFDVSVANGARPSFAPVTLGDDVVLAEVELYGDVVLRYISRNDDKKCVKFLPFSEKVEKTASFLEYVKAFTGFYEFAEFTTEDVGTSESGLNSVVLACNNENVLIPMNEPVYGTKRKSQIQTYLEHNEGAGVQHLALASEDIFRTLREMRKRNSINKCEELGILVDRDGSVNVCWRITDLSPILDSMTRNSDQKTPHEVFSETNYELRAQAKNWMSENAKNCSIVAVLIATVAFTSVYTIPGGTGDDGNPVLKDKPTFLLFTFADAISLSSALTSLILFLNIVTSRFQFQDFASSIFKKQYIALTLLIISVTMMMVSFAATLILTISNDTKWTAEMTLYGVTFFPVLVFILSYVPDYERIIKELYSSSKKLIKENVVANFHNFWDYKPQARHPAARSVNLTTRSPV
nr:ankyrin repeat-containing protein At5g02620-like [Tanacetum cinerariifolium]